MIYKLDPIEVSPLDYVWLKDFGTYNKMPTPCVEIDENEYIIHTRTYLPKYIEFRQLSDILNASTVLSTQIYWYHNFAIAIVYPDNGRLERDIVKYHNGHPYFSIVRDKVKYRPRLRYFRIGCEHNFKELSKKESINRGISHYGMCWHVYECQTCGYIESHDSSD